MVPEDIMVPGFLNRELSPWYESYIVENRSNRKIAIKSMTNPNVKVGIEIFERQPNL